MHRTWTGTLAVALALLAAAGCGGDDGGAATRAASSTLSATQLRAKAEAICAPFAERYARATESGGSGGGPEATPAQRRRYARAIDRGTRIRLDIAAELDELDPPAALRRNYDRFVEALRAVARGYPTAAETIAFEDPRAGERDEARRVSAELGTKLGIGAACG
jgi:hypothetical protein